jgi:ABC-type microcin C transport system duplicated ATPase subunit YejF
VSALLEVKDLRVQFETRGALVNAVDGISYSVDRGRMLAIVGEAGSGKTAASLAILGLTQGTTGRISGRVLFEGRDLLALGPAQLRAIRGNDIGIAFQDPLAALHPLYTVGAQVIETIVAHRQISKAAARDRTIDLLEWVGIPDSRHHVDQYPEQLSPEIRRRVTLAMALANEPKLLIADEPTAGLDVTVQPQILQVLDQVRQRRELATIITTRDLGLIEGIADEIQILTQGRLVERPVQSSSST